MTFVSHCCSNHIVLDGFTYSPLGLAAATDRKINAFKRCTYEFLPNSAAHNLVELDGLIIFFCIEVTTVTEVLQINEAGACNEHLLVPVPARRVPGSSLVSLLSKLDMC